MRSTRLGRTLTVLAMTVTAGVLVGSASASADTGGVGPGGETAPPSSTPPTPTPQTPTGPPGKATLLSDGSALAPSDAPQAVAGAIAAANQIRLTPYIWGGGHASFLSSGYDCSGSVSYALHGAGLLPSPLPSGPLMSWGLPGRGRWITVYANSHHTFAMIAGLRWDTSAFGFGSGRGPRWRANKRPKRGYAVRHYVGY